MTDLEKRLRNHSGAFGQLLSLIPAKHYFSADGNSTQWNKRKQTKEESQRAKKAKLDPDSVMSAADMRQKQQRKAAGNENEEEDERVGGDERVEEPMTKKQRKQRKKQFANETKVAVGTVANKAVKTKPEKHKNSVLGNWKEVEAEGGDGGEAEEIPLNRFNFSTHLTASPSSPPKLNPIEISKSSSVISAEQRAGQRARLAARIEALRAKRRADSPDGTSARNRRELMVARRREEAVQRKERKKEIRLHQKAAAESTKTVTSSPAKSSMLKRSEAENQSQISGRDPKDRSPDKKESSKDRQVRVSKKVNSKKSRPGFEGSLKSSKRGKK